MLQKYHFSPALRVDQTVYVSGQIGVGEDGLPLLDAEAQFVAAFESLADLLALGGCGFEDVVDVMSFHTSFDQFDLFIAVRDRYLLGPVFPCWTAVGAELGLAGALVEVKCVAVRKSINGSV
jgi:enamine deaminase RidA (YjgF/YER057c/UK114 family)